jgi:streptogramin lyase
MTQGLGSLWVAGRSEIARIDPVRASIVKRYHIAGPVNALATGPGSLYYTDSNKEALYRVALPSGRVTPLGRATSQPGALALAGSRAFVTDDGANSVTAMDPATGRRGATIVLRRAPAVGNNQPDGLGLVGIALANDSIWLPDWDANRVYRVPLSKLGG